VCLLPVPTQNKGGALAFFFPSFVRSRECSLGCFVCRFLGGWDASGHHFGGMFVTFGAPGPLWAPLGVPFGNFGRPGGEKGRTRAIPLANGSPHFDTFMRFFVKIHRFLVAFFQDPLFHRFLSLSGAPRTSWEGGKLQREPFPAKLLVQRVWTETRPNVAPFWRPLGTLFVFFVVLGVSKFCVFFKRADPAQPGPSGNEESRGKWIWPP